MTLHDDATGPGRTATEQALVARLRALSAEVAATPDEDFRAATRTRLVAMAAVRTPATRRPPVREGLLRRLAGAAPDASTSRWRTRLTAGLAGAALTVTAVGGLLGAAQGARPGDLLYDLKIGGEHTQLALAGDSRGTTLLTFASTRLDELQELVGVQTTADAVVGSTPSGGEAGLAAGPDADLVLQTLQTMDEQTTEGTAAVTSRAVRETDPDAVEVLARWTVDQQDGLGAVVDAVPTGTEDALTAARDLVGRVATRATDLRTALDCPGGASTQGSDELGPVPAPCAVDSPATTTEGSTASTVSASTGGPSGTAGTTAAAPGGSAAASGTAAPAPSGGPAPTAVVPGLPTSGALPSVPAPKTSGRPGLPSLPVTIAPSGPVLPSPLPTVVSASPLIPGVCIDIPLVQVC